jgi:hypothetical protein
MTTKPRPTTKTETLKGRREELLLERVRGEKPRTQLEGALYVAAVLLDARVARLEREVRSLKRSLKRPPRPQAPRARKART